MDDYVGRIYVHYLSIYYCYLFYFQSGLQLLLNLKFALKKLPQLILVLMY